MGTQPFLARNSAIPRCLRVFQQREKERARGTMWDLFSKQDLEKVHITPIDQNLVTGVTTNHKGSTQCGVVN